MSDYTQQNQGDVNRNNSDSGGGGYVDFNQFIQQHNFNSTNHQQQGVDYYSYPFNNQLYTGNFLGGMQDAAPFPNFSNELAASSNLVPTAAEFVPRFSNLSLSDAKTEIPAPCTLEENRDQFSNMDSLRNVNQYQPEPETSTNNKNQTTGAIRKQQTYNNDRGRNNMETRGYNDSRFDSYDSYYRGNGYFSKNKSRNDSVKNTRRKDNWRGYKDTDMWGNSDARENETISSISKNSNKIDQYQQQHSNTKPVTSPIQTWDGSEKYSQREKLIQEIEGRKLECLVCVESIKAHQPIWSCSNCFHILHLSCTIKWASSSKSDDGWRCPACQNTTKKIPRDYYCFCGKTKNPQYNRSDIAHSCGELCERKELCVNHSCTILCHPGPCPPCQATVTRECGCGKTSKIMQCCIKEDPKCSEKCEKLLNCELHTCQAECHFGKCLDCERKVDHKCHCGKVEKQVLCTRESNDKKTYSCGKTCNRPLSCGNHKCRDSCHQSDCRPCKLTPQMVTHCPCGKTTIEENLRKSCVDPIPVCNNVCRKVLKCGPATNPHFCVSKCHLGGCPPCNKQTAVRCRCGHMDQMIKCRQLATRADDARCKKRCTKKRNCGKHKCNQECCIDIDHICPLPCTYNLSCGKHKCDQSCHKGNCQSCYRSSFDELYCECGANVIYPPVPCGTKRPICDKPCTRSHPCDHPVQHSCHSFPHCPPCMMFTTKWCHGNHEQRKTIPCSQDTFSCGMACNKDLVCQRHKCVKPCHAGQCQIEGEICKQSCKALRTVCGHKCNAQCHDGDCPDTPCKENVEVTCDCGNRKQMRTCHDFSSDYRRIATAQLASSMQEMQRGNMVELSDILGPIKMTNNKTLECNDECKTLERNRRLAIGLQIRNPDLSSKLLTRYSDFVKNWAKKDPQLVTMIHNKLTELVKLAKESKQRSRSHSFPTMNKDKRQLVHEMCGMFGVDSVAYDAEPNRNVVATAYKERSWLPAMSIMEVLRRESGQRRVPVPNNNAWGIKK